MKTLIFLISLFSIIELTQGQVCAQNASSSSGQCVCNNGYWGVDASQNGMCFPCTSPGAITTQVSNTGAGSNASVCNTCDKGYYMVLAANIQGQTGASCVKCPDYSAQNTQQTTVNSISSCVCFDSNAAPLSLSQNTCACKSGQGNVAQSASAPSGCSSASKSNSAIKQVFFVLLSISFFI
ncbi:immobilization antigen (macronuclear) [Tetrahymena thermophila SB210]|uniref:Immobilization antigen n=1 Tax=Tetrahymena thermophila (strain SB210) TaxID=312017 RepID=W7WXU1_TETTS|nr:immobilization antigen [Tetrahymena thermophila SB210]EWS71655.1 immobilization antigen [Tetrahymena thermophila SB210]|eukprot:XP_012655815.1 immobilization antigen [Tetrahymena thermophila SB210]